jgi:hypothetical protein
VLWISIASIVVSVVLRAVYLTQPWRIDWAALPTFLGDEGAHGLMALHIQRGARPVFYYGAYYHGAFDAYLSALAFSIFGRSVATLRAIPGLFALASIPLAYAITRRLYGHRQGLLAGTLVALPSTFAFEWGTLSLCGYCGYAAFVLLMLYMVLLVFERVSMLRLGVLGLAAGLSIWSNQLSIAYAGICGLALLLWVPLRRKHVAVLLVAGTIGVLPLIYGNIAQPFSTARQLGRKAFYAWSLAKTPVDESEQERPREYRALPLLEVLGAQPRIDGTLSPLGAIGALFLVLGALGGAHRCYRAYSRDQEDFHRHALVIALIGVTLAVGAGGFAGQPVGRYQLPLYPLAAILAAGWIVERAPRLAVGLVGLVALTHAAAIAAPVPRDARTPPDLVINALREKGLRYGYAAGPMYELMFRSREYVVLAPLDHSRYAPYEASVSAADQVFYVYRNSQQSKIAHRVFTGHLKRTGVRYQQVDLGEYHILYGFEPRDGVSAEVIARVRDDFRKQKFGW